MRRKRAEERRRLVELRSAPLFRDCSDDELRAVDAIGTRISIDPRTRLTTEGAGARECYVLLEGAVAVSSGGSPVATLGPGSIVGETALLTRRPRNATVEALTPLSVILMHHAEFAELMRIPTVEAKVRSVWMARKRAVRQGSQAPTPPDSRQADHRASQPPALHGAISAQPRHTTAATELVPNGHDPA